MTQQDYKIGEVVYWDNEKFGILQANIMEVLPDGQIKIRVRRGKKIIIVSSNRITRGRPKRSLP